MRKNIVPQRSTARQCSSCTGKKHRPAAALRENPQNQPQAVVQPSPHLTPEEAVAAQLDALSRNDEPWWVGYAASAMCMGILRDLPSARTHV